MHIAQFATFYIKKGELYKIGRTNVCVRFALDVSESFTPHIQTFGTLFAHKNMKRQVGRTGSNVTLLNIIAPSFVIF